MTTPAAIGPYRVVRELGRGGMGVVYEVQDPAAPRTLALKQVLGDQAGPEALARFEREATLLGRCRHPNVVVVHTVGRGPQGPYLVTDLVPGEDLKTACRAGPLEPRRAARIVRALADALAAIHAQGVIHRDLKPENVLLRPSQSPRGSAAPSGSGQSDPSAPSRARGPLASEASLDADSPVLLDFGLARELDAQSLTRSGALVGTPAYMAPEQLDGPRGLDERTDVYGLGGVLYTLLAGRPPFQGSMVEVLSRVAHKEPPSTSSLVPAVPAALDAVVRRSMAKARGARYATAAELRDDLDRWLRGERPLAHAGRSRAPLVAGAALALLLAAAGAAAKWSGATQPAPRSTKSTPPASPAAPTPEGELARLPRSPPPPGRARLARWRAIERWLATWPEHAAAPKVRELARDLIRSRLPLVVVPGPPLARWADGPGRTWAVFVGPDRLVCGTDHTDMVHTADLMAERPLAELARSHGASDVGWAVRSVAWVGPEHGVAFGGDGMRLHRVDPASKVELGAWDVPDRRPMFMPEVEGDAAALARLSPDKRREMCVADTPDVSVIAADRARGRVLVGGAWHQAWVLEAAPGGWKEVATIRGLPTLLADAAFSADGSRVALVCSVSGTRFAEAESPEALQAAKRWFRVLVADAATGDDLTARVVRPEDVDGVTRPRAVAWSPDGRLVVGRDGGIVQAVTDRRPDVVGSISANGAPTKGADVTDLAFGRGDGGDVLWFVTGVDAVKDPSASKGTGTLAGCRWPPGRPGPEPLRLEGLEGIVSIDLSPCGRLAALGHTDGSVSVFPLTPP